MPIHNLGRISIHHVLTRDKWATISFTSCAQFLQACALLLMLVIVQYDHYLPSWRLTVLI